MTNKVKLIRDRLLSNKFEFFIVGGRVRDYLICKKTSKDIDIATNARPDDIKRIFSDQKLSFVGKSFLVSLVNGIEVATYRKDKYFGLSDKNAEITFADSIYDDLLRRDLTINAIAMDKDGNIIDPTNGYNDILNKTIRFVGDPYHTIWCDPNRILRALRFRTLTGFNYDPKTLDACKASISLFRGHVHPERIKEELIKVMKIHDFRQFFYDCHALGILKWILEPLDACWGLPGGPYHNEDVFTHCLDTGYHYPKRYPYMRLMAMLHDIGKEEAAFKDENNEWHFYNHENKTDKVEECLEYLRFSKTKIKQAIGLVKTHMLFDENLSKKQARKALTILKEHGVPYCCWIHLGLADKKANHKHTEAIGLDKTRRILKTIDNVLESDGKFASNPNNIAITGTTIMSRFGIPSGPSVGRIKQHIFEAIQDSQCINTEDSIGYYITENFANLEELII